MHCPKCGVENPNVAEKCNSCGCVLTTISKKKLNPNHRRSVSAVASFVLAILSVAFILGGWGILGLLFSIILAISAIVFGITSLVKISKSARPLKGKGLAILGIVIPVVSYAIVLTTAIIVVRRQSIHALQKNQFATIDLSLAAFRNDYGDYPPSGTRDETNQHYCGAQMLAEALLGQDLMGFHPDSQFKSDGTDASGNLLYISDTLDARKRPYLEIENAKVYQLKDVFKDVGTFDGERYVLCDFYIQRRHSGKKTGMPILYYRANISSKTMAASAPMKERIYDATDNLTLIHLAGTRDDKTHPLANDDGEFFYHRDYKIIDPKVTVRAWPYRPHSFILISAGKDGLYGTTDDIVNFDR